MNHPKYIVWENDRGTYFATVFNPLVNHSEVQVQRAEAVSAGFFTFDAEGKVYTFGESISRNLKANTLFDDAPLVVRALGLDPQENYRIARDTY